MDQSTQAGESFITGIFRHNTWANLRLLEACRQLSDEQMDATVPGTYGSIRDTLFHIVGGEMSYVGRVTGREPENSARSGEFPGIDALERYARWCGEELLQLAPSARAGDVVTEVWENKKGQYNLTDLLTQAINHATEHRAQVATVLTQQGIEPPDMSGWAYMEDMGRFTETEI